MCALSLLYVSKKQKASVYPSQQEIIYSVVISILPPTKNTSSSSTALYSEHYVVALCWFVKVSHFQCLHGSAVIPATQVNAWKMCRLTHIWMWKDKYILVRT